MAIAPCTSSREVCAASGTLALLEMSSIWWTRRIATKFCNSIDWDGLRAVLFPALLSMKATAQQPYQVSLRPGPGQGGCINENYARHIVRYYPGLLYRTVERWGRRGRRGRCDSCDWVLTFWITFFRHLLLLLPKINHVDLIRKIQQILLVYVYTIHLRKFYAYESPAIRIVPHSNQHNGFSRLYYNYSNVRVHIMCAFSLYV